MSGENLQHLLAMIVYMSAVVGIGIYFEEQNIDTMSGDGELMLTILASYAQEESRSFRRFGRRWAASAAVCLQG